MASNGPEERLERVEIINGMVKLATAQEVSELKDQYNRIKRDIAVLQDQQKQVLAELQSKCDHSGIIYFAIDSPKGPVQMCSVCGWEEELWANKIKHPPRLPDPYSEEGYRRTVTMKHDSFLKQRI